MTYLEYVCAGVRTLQPSRSSVFSLHNLLRDVFLFLFFKPQPPYKKTITLLPLRSVQADMVPEREIFVGKRKKSVRL